MQGALQLRERRRDARFVFLLPPSLDELERRLRGRGTDAPEVVASRLAEVRRELAAVHAFDYAVVNDDVERTIASAAAPSSPRSAAATSPRCAPRMAWPR